MGKIEIQKNLLTKKMPKNQKATDAKVATAKKTATKVKKAVTKGAHKVYYKPRFYKTQCKHQKRAQKLLKHVKRHIKPADGALTCTQLLFNQLPLIKTFKKWKTKTP